MSDFDIKPPEPKLACEHLDWRNTSADPDDMPDRHWHRDRSLQYARRIAASASPGCFQTVRVGFI